MAQTSIIEVQVQDQAFKNLKAEFDLFNAAVKAQPAAWAAVSAQTVAVNKSITAAAQGSAVVTKAAVQAAASQKAAVKQAVGLRKEFDGLAASSKALAKNVGNVTRDLVKWVGIGSIFAGLTGAGSLFGLDRLAQAVSAGRKSAQGVGVSYGEQSAFRLNYGRYLDPDATLQRFADAKSDLNKRVAFSSLGISPADVDRLDPAELALRALPEAAKRFTQGGGTQQYADAMRLTDLFDIDTLRRTAAQPDGALDKSQAAYRKGVAAYGLDDTTQTAWQNLDTQLSAAGLKIETVLVKGLTPLAEPIEHLSDAVADAIKTMLSNPHLKEWMDEFGQGIDHLATYMGTDKFQADVKAAVDGVAAFGAAVAHAASWVEGLFPSASKSDSNPAAGNSTGDVPQAEIETWRKNATITRKDSAELMDWEALQAKQFGVPSALQQGIFKLEGGITNEGDAKVSTMGAIGIGQLLPGTAKEMGVNPYNTADNVVGSTKYMAQMLAKFGGNALAAGAAYNAGPGGHGVKEFAASGDESGLPRETRKYVDDLRRMGVGSAPANDAPNPRALDLFGSELNLIEKMETLARARRAAALAKLHPANDAGLDATQKAINERSAHADQDFGPEEPLPNPSSPAAVAARKAAVARAAGKAGASEPAPEEPMTPPGRAKEIAYRQGRGGTRPLIRIEDRTGGSVHVSVTGLVA